MQWIKGQFFFIPHLGKQSSLIFFLFKMQKIEFPYFSLFQCYGKLFISFSYFLLTLFLSSQPTWFIFKKITNAPNTIKWKYVCHRRLLKPTKWYFLCFSFKKEHWMNLLFFMLFWLQFPLWGHTKLEITIFFCIFVRSFCRTRHYTLFLHSVFCFDLHEISFVVLNKNVQVWAHAIFWIKRKNGRTVNMFWPVVTRWWIISNGNNKLFASKINRKLVITDSFFLAKALIMEDEI